jgi:glycosyltransferase involved in cell wall biosynthesis
MTVAICICTFNRPELLARVLGVLRNLQTGTLKPEQIAIIVVDNNPDGRVAAVCDRLRGQLPVRLVLIAEKRRGISFARNRAVDEALRAGFDFVAFIDDDDRPETDWLDKLMQKQRETRADIVCGAIPAVVDPRWPDWLKNSPLFAPSGGKSETKFGIPQGIGSGNVLIDSRLLARLKTAGPVFSPEFALIGGEDTEFYIRAKRSGARIVKAEKAVVHRHHHGPRITFRGLLVYALHRGNYSAHILRVHGTPQQIRVRLLKAVKKLSLGVIQLPACALSKTALAAKLFQIAIEVGFFYGLMGGNILEFSHHGKRHNLILQRKGRGNK